VIFTIAVLPVMSAVGCDRLFERPRSAPLQSAVMPPALVRGQDGARLHRGRVDDRRRDDRAGVADATKLFNANMAA
jgi:hypothetical protein